METSVMYVALLVIGFLRKYVKVLSLEFFLLKILRGNDNDYDINKCFDRVCRTMRLLKKTKNKVE